MASSEGAIGSSLEVLREKEINKCLQQLADRVRATDAYIDNGIELCEKVRLLLQKEVSQGNKPYSIAATYYAGSVGKHTDVVAPDFDLVFKINERKPPFHDVLNYFEEKLREHSKELKILPGSITQTKINHAVQFSFSNGMEVDLLPATADLTNKQLDAKLKRLRKSKNYSSKDWVIFSSSFVDEQKSFMKKQSSFAHRVARLSKHWFNSLDFPESDGKVCGGSTIFELLGVEAALQLEKNGGEPMPQALTRVMDNVENIDTLKLAFKKDADNNWRVMSGNDLLPDGRGQVSSLHKDNYIIEPSIRLNNILKKMTPETKQQFKEYARIMKGRLENVQTGKIEIHQIFDPLPVTMEMPRGADSIIPPVVYVTQATPKKDFIHTPATIIRNKNLTPEQLKVASVLTNRLATTVTTVASTVCYNPQSREQQVGRCQTMVGSSKAVIKTTFPGMIVNEAKMTDVKMKNFDAVISVPYRSADRKCVMVGLGWSSKSLGNVDKSRFY